MHCLRGARDADELCDGFGGPGGEWPWLLGVGDVGDEVGELGAAGQGGAQVGGQGAVGGVGGDGQGRVDGAQGVLDDDVIAVAGEQDADRGAVAVLGSTQLLVDGGDVEGELAEVLGLDRADLELEDDEPAQAEVEDYLRPAEGWCRSTRAYASGTTSTT